ncbi:MAG: hypothetical protein ABI175_22925, partial [Polyangiales bacterium]
MIGGRAGGSRGFSIDAGFIAAQVVAAALVVGAIWLQSVPLYNGSFAMNLKKSLFLLPNIITMASIFCGFDAIRLASDARGDDDFWRA